MNQTKTQALAELSRVQRELENQKRKRAREETLEDQIAKIMKELRHSANPSLARKRELLAQVLSGGRVRVRFDPPAPLKRKSGEPHKAASTSAGFTMTFPSFGGLPEITVDTKRDIWSQMLGPRFVGDTYLGTQYLGVEMKAIQKQLDDRLRAMGGKILSRKVLPDGSIETIRQVEIPD